MTGLPGKMTHQWQEPFSHSLKRVTVLSEVLGSRARVTSLCEKSTSQRQRAFLFQTDYFVSRLEVLTFFTAHVVILPILTGVEGEFLFQLRSLIQWNWVAGSAHMYHWYE